MTDQIPKLQAMQDDIDLYKVINNLWQGRKMIIKSVLIFGIVGVIVAITTPKEFIAKTVMVPAYGGDGSAKLGGLSNLGGLAAMAGLSLNATSGSELSPLVYPQIVNSLPFQLDLMNTPLDFPEYKRPVTLFEYYTSPQKDNIVLKYTIGLPKLILGIPDKIFSIFRAETPIPSSWNNQSNLIELTKNQSDVRLLLSEIISLNVNTKDGLITLSSTMPEARAAAQLGQKAQILLQQYVTEFKIKKAKANLDFIQQRYDETAIKFETAQEKLALFRDRNKNVSLATAKTEEEKLISQYSLILSIFSELSKQLEQAKIQVKQETPVFTIIEPVSIPLKKSKPDRITIILIWLLIGTFSGIGYLVGKEYLFEVIQVFKEKS